MTVLKLIDEAVRNSATSLDLGGCDDLGKGIPLEIGGLADCLTKLSLGSKRFERDKVKADRPEGQHIADLAGIRLLDKLTHLSISGLAEVTRNQFEMILALPNLEYLDMEGTILIDEVDLNLFGPARRLKYLNLSRCPWAYWPFSMPGSLKELHLAGCERIQGDVACDSQLLEILNLRDNQLTELELRNVSNLVSLDLEECRQLEALRIDRAPKLKELKLRMCQGLRSLKTAKAESLSVLICTGLKKLRNLELKASRLVELNLNHCPNLNLDEVWLNKDNLPSLRKVTMYGDKPDGFTLERLETLLDRDGVGLVVNNIKNVHDTLQSQHDEQDVAGILGAYRELSRQSPTSECSFLRVSVLGNKSSGKTTLVNSLTNPNFRFNKGDNISTSKADIRWESFNTMMPGKTDGHADKRLQIWDFPGQRVYHEINRGFLSSCDLFIVVWRRDEEALQFDDPDQRPLQYWVEMILGSNPSFGNNAGGSPRILFVETHSASASCDDSIQEALGKKHCFIEESWFVRTEAAHWSLGEKERETAKKSKSVILSKMLSVARELKKPALLPAKLSTFVSGEVIGLGNMGRVLSNEAAVNYIHSEYDVTPIEAQGWIDILHRYGFIHQIAGTDSNEGRKRGRVYLDPTILLDMFYGCCDVLKRLRGHIVGKADLRNAIKRGTGFDDSEDQVQKNIEDLIDAGLISRIDGLDKFIIPWLLVPSDPPKLSPADACWHTNPAAEESLDASVMTEIVMYSAKNEHKIASEFTDLDFDLSTFKTFYHANSLEHCFGDEFSYRLFWKPQRRGGYDGVIELIVRQGTETMSSAGADEIRGQVEEWLSHLLAWRKGGWSLSNEGAFTTIAYQELQPVVQRLGVAFRKMDKAIADEVIEVWKNMGGVNKQQRPVTNYLMQEEDLEGAGPLGMRAKLSVCDFVVILVSKDFLSSMYCLRELVDFYFPKRDEKCIIIYAKGGKELLRRLEKSDRPSEDEKDDALEGIVEFWTAWDSALDDPVTLKRLKNGPRNLSKEAKTVKARELVARINGYGEPLSYDLPGWESDLSKRINQKVAGANRKSRP